MNTTSSLFDDDSFCIGSETPVKDVMSALATRGCLDLTLTINSSTCSDFPLAGGGFCDVYQGATNHETQVAIKALRLYDRPGKENEKEKVLKRAARELYHWSRLRHPNVLPLMGLAMFRGRISMVSEWMENGSLPSYISLNPGVNRINLCMNICAGLSYIHANEMIHGDLKGANVMISRDGVAMIADFGNSQLRDLTLKFTNTSTSSITVRWAAPELLDENSSARLSKKSDVYAYGMTVLETLTGKVPFDGFSDHQVIIMVAFKHKIPARPTVGVDGDMWEMLMGCWLREPSERPDIAIIEARLLAMFGNAEASNYTPIEDKEASSLSYSCLYTCVKVWGHRGAASKANQTTNLLISNASHEVRTPLNQIINHLEIALDRQLDSETRENLVRSHTASRSLLFTINDLLELTRHEYGNETLFNEPFDLPGMIEDAVTLYRIEALRSQIQFVVNTSDCPRMVTGDSKKIRTAVSNLTANAVKFTKAGQITVECRQFREPIGLRDLKEVVVEIVVADTGCGISSARLESIFREFEQVEPLTLLRGEPQVLGLGLAVVARIVEQLGGQLRVDSRQGRGSRFSFLIPFSLPGRPPVDQSPFPAGAYSASTQTGID